MTFSLALITPLVAGIIAVYAIFPDLLTKDAKPWRRMIAAGLILLGIVTSGWSAYSAAKDQKYLVTALAIGEVHDSVNRIWSDFKQGMFGSSGADGGVGELNEAIDLIRQGRTAEASSKISDLTSRLAPDKKKLAQVIREIDELRNVIGRPGVPEEVRARAYFFGVTVRILALRNSTIVPLSPSLLFAAVAGEESQKLKGKLTLTPQKSELLWYTGYFRPSDFAPPRRILTVDDNGRLVIDSSKFDDDFLFSRATYIIDWFEQATQ